jgi:hypothetical protein
MSNLLLGLMWMLGAIPAITCAVYFNRRLGARRDLLRETLISMELCDYYLRARHPECQDLSLESFNKSFAEDFRVGLSEYDFLWPVGLFTVVSFIGWYVTLSVAYGSFSALKTPLPAAFVFGFVGAYMASMFAIFDDFRTLSLDPYGYYSATGRALFATVAAYVASVAAPAVFQASVVPLISLAIGLIPVEDVWSFIVNRASQIAGTAGAEGERGLGLKVIQGLEDRETRKRLVDMNIATVEALATCDPFALFFQTTLPLRSIIDMIDKAILYLYIGDTTADLRQHGINGVIELVALAHLGKKEPAYEVGNTEGTAAINPFFADVDADKLVLRVGATLKLEPDELKAFIYNCYYDPQISLIYDIWGKYLNPKTITATPAQKAASAG